MVNKVKKNKVKKIIPVCIAVLCLAVSLHAVEVKKIDIHQFQSFQQGEFKGTSLDNKGRLFIGPRLRQVTGPESEYYLSLDTAGNGDIYVGSGHKAAVYRIKPGLVLQPGAAADSAIRQVFATDALDVYALLVKKNGNVFAGTSPDGKIFKVTPNAGKEGKEFFNPDEKFIWDMKEDANGNIICAVGNSGGVYRIAPDGQADKIFTSEDTHIISLYITRDGGILAGSGDRGIIYRIDNRKVKVLYDSPFDEIRGICQDKDGNTYFSATRGISREDTLGRRNQSFKQKKKKEAELLPPEKSALYCLHTSGVVEKIWTLDNEYIYSVIYDAKTHSVVVGTGDSGRVYRVKPDGSFSIIFESDSAQIFKLSDSNRGVVLITNNTAAITEIEDAPNSRGTYYSDVFDLEIQSKLGRLYWDATTSPQTDVQLFVRTGNSSVPDSTWSQWSPPYTDSQNARLDIPNTRYFQVKAVLNSGSAAQTPYLNQFKVFYVQSNLPPQVKMIDIRKPKPKRPTPGSTAKTAEQNTADSNSLEVRWYASDINNDKLKYNIFIKKENTKSWILVKENTTKRAFLLKTSLYQDGKYLMKITADDALANPPALARSGQLESTPFLIDSMAPVVRDFNVSGTKVRFTVTDQTSIIAGVHYSLDGKLWYPLFPVDMINDSASESFDVEIKELRSGKFIFIKVRDEFDNSNVFQEEF